MFKVYTGKPSVKYFGKGDTTIKILNGGVVRLLTTGKLGVLGNDSDDAILGVSAKTVATADSDDSVPVMIAEEGVEWEVETDSDGGASATDVGRFCAIDTGDTTNPNATVDISDSVIPAFFITSIVSATKVRGRLGRTALRKPSTHDLDT